MNEIIKKIRRFELQIRIIINSKVKGDFHSVFKGSGLEFDDVRAYHYGDDVRAIDWNVTAKGHGTFVKTFKEEKEQNVFIVMDVSASQTIDRNEINKIDLAKEICGIMAFTAVKQSSHVGLICFSDKKELFIKPNKGIKHAYYITLNALKLEPKSSGTDINQALTFSLNSLKKKSVVILISDFIDDNYEKNLIALALKHDLVVIHLADKKETDLPNLGIIPIFDTETKKTIWVNSSSSKIRQKINKWFVENQKKLERMSKEFNFNYTRIETHEDYLPKLVRLFKTRKKSKKSVA